ncbi:MAG: PIG-L family deacetylase [Acidobacteria bacterium]|nr:PIG-L family deacetylase [Acidobacteriota bacterium]
MNRVLAYMAHPDDAEFLVGGTLFRLKSLGWEIGIATMTAGDCGSDRHSKEEIARIRLGEAEAAAGFLGAGYVCTGLMDGEVFMNTENLRLVVDRMRSFAPDVVITHSPVDYMMDHEETSRLVRAAAFVTAMPLYLTRQPSPSAVTAATPALYYADPVEGLDHHGRRIYPDFYVDIAQVMENKRTMLSMHRSQREWLQRHHGIDEYLNRMAAWAQAYGRECNFAYAEGLRQHLGHGYPHDPVIQSALGTQVRLRRRDIGRPDPA